jgi:hypothetical protein
MPEFSPDEEGVYEDEGPWIPRVLSPVAQAQPEEIPAPAPVRHLTDSEILAGCRELLARSGPKATVRALQEVLYTRYQRRGKTTRILRLWHQVAEEPPTPVDESATLARARLEVAEAERIAREALNSAESERARAELAEMREQAHQDHWAMQLDGLKQQLAKALQDTVRLPQLEKHVLELHRELARVRGELASANGEVEEGASESRAGAA